MQVPRYCIIETGVKLCQNKKTKKDGSVQLMKSRTMAELVAGLWMPGLHLEPCTLDGYLSASYCVSLKT